MAIQIIYSGTAPKEIFNSITDGQELPAWFFEQIVESILEKIESSDFVVCGTTHTESKLLPAGTVMFSSILELSPKKERQPYTAAKTNPFA